MLEFASNQPTNSDALPPSITGIRIITKKPNISFFVKKIKSYFLDTKKEQKKSKKVVETFTAFGMPSVELASLLMYCFFMYIYTYIL